MRTSTSRKTSIAVVAFVSLGLISGCASQPATQPTPQVINVPDPTKAAAPGPVTLDQTIKKDLFNINLSPRGIQVNGVKVADIKALDKLLAQYAKPVITIATHRCYSNEAAAKVISLAQSHTVTPIAIGSFGDVSDPQCQ